MSTDPWNGTTYRLPCDMTAGSSGGPWLTGFDGSGNSRTLSSVNSYTYNGITARQRAAVRTDYGSNVGRGRRAGCADVIVP